jgi:RecA-family ATPase
MAVTMKNAVFWDAALCGSCKNLRFGIIYLHHHGKKNQRARNEVSIDWQRRSLIFSLVMEAIRSSETSRSYRAI